MFARRRSLLAALAATFALTTVPACEIGLDDGEGTGDIAPPDWIIGTWEDDRGEQWRFSSDDIETTTAGVLTSLFELYDDIVEIENTDTVYAVEASLLGLPAEFRFEMTSETTFVTSNVTYTKL